jgi:hypothetical protein
VTVDPVEIPKEHKTDLWLSRISSFVSVVVVFAGLLSELSIPNSFNQAVYVMLFTHTNNIIRAKIITWVTRRTDRCSAICGSLNIDIERVLIDPLTFFNSNLYQRLQIIGLFYVPLEFQLDRPSLYWIPKWHKSPYKQRYFAGLPNVPWNLFSYY